MKRPASLMLATAAKDLDNLRYPLLASPKLDGIRAIVLDGVVLSRSFKPIPNLSVQRIFGRAKYNGLDGELIVGRADAPNCFRTTSSAVMSRDTELEVPSGSAGSIAEVTFRVFDDFSTRIMELPFVGRLESAQNRIGDHRGFRQVPHVTLTGKEQLELFEQKCIEQGFEGVMVRDPYGPYKEGRSTYKEGYLLKLKRFEDGEARVLGFTELMHNANEERTAAGRRSTKKGGLEGRGMLGAFQVQDLKTGASFDLGGGFTQADREIFWAMRDDLMRRIVKYKFFPLGSKSKPRFPTFQGFRDPIDL